MEYIYKDRSFTGTTTPEEFRWFCLLIRSKSLTRAALNTALASITQNNCVDCYRLGKSFGLQPLQRRAWKLAILNNWLREASTILSTNIDTSVEINSSQETALLASIDRGHTDLACMLIAAGASPNIPNFQGMTPLAQTVHQDNLELSELLIKSGADVNATDQWGNTPLFVASYRGLENMVRLLLKHGADAMLSNRQGYTPLDVAALCGKLHTLSSHSDYLLA